MHINRMPRLQLGDLTVQVPIIQGGMGVGISRSGLASAVANQGGIGVIASVGLDLMNGKIRGRTKGSNTFMLKEEIRQARRLTKGIIGVNVMMALTDFEQLVDATIEEGADVLFLGAGLPLNISKQLTPEHLRHLKTKIVPIVSSDRAARLIFQYWSRKYNRVPDGVVVEGPKAGGHLGFRKEQIFDPAFALEKLVPAVVSAVLPFEQEYGTSIPVIAGGGIFTGQDIHKILQLGAQGVQMATRFIATFECDADDAFKQAILNAGEKDVMIIDSPVGLPGRAIRNAFLDDVTAGIKKPFKCPFKCLRTCDYKTVPYCIALALTNAQRGKLEDGFAFTGANAHRVHSITSVKALMDSLIQEYELAAEAAWLPASFEPLGTSQSKCSTLELRSHHSSTRPPSHDSL
ncbi:MAG: nitronate monooxygenase [Calditrichaeota bacterium]|nr:MAG: nitronate monooxygenase [Calditrichota bacterium]